MDPRPSQGSPSPTYFNQHTAHHRGSPTYSDLSGFSQPGQPVHTNQPTLSDRGDFNQTADYSGSHSIVNGGHVPASSERDEGNISPISPTSPTLPSKKKYLPPHVEDVSTTTLEPQPINTLPDWRPRSLNNVPFVASVFIAAVIIVYAALYIYGKQNGHRYIVETGTGVNWLFRFGPVILAVVISEMMSRVDIDLTSVLPYIAISSALKDRRRREHLAQLSEPVSWKEKVSSILSLKNREGIKVVSIWCTLVLVPIQTGLFSTGARVLSTSKSPFGVVNLNTLAATAQYSDFPKVAFEAIYNGQNVTDFKWITTMDDNYHPASVAWVLMMPFAPTNKSTNMPKGANWNATTTALYSYLNCSQINDFDVSVLSTTVEGNTRRASNVTVVLSDPISPYCRQKAFNFSSVSTEFVPGPDNPILADGSFAMWGRGCGGYSYYLVSGPLVTSSRRSFQADTSVNSGWGALVCDSHYWAIPNTIEFEVKSNASNTGVPSHIAMGDGVDIQKANDIFTSGTLMPPMQRNILDTGLIYNITSPLTGRTFWGQQTARNPFEEWTGFDLNGENINCTSLGLNKTRWQNNKACEMYAIAGDLWSFSIAVAGASTALYIPASQWNETTGVISATKDGWYLSGFSFIYTFVAYAFVLVLLFAEMHLSLNYFGIWKSTSKSRTGLHGSASSIAGLASVFQDPSSRKLFEGVDTLKREAALKSNRETIPASKLLLRRWTSGSSNTMTPAIARPSGDRADPSEVKGVRREDVRKDLETLRYGKAPAIARTYSLVFLSTGVIIGVVFPLMIFSDRTAFQMWPQPTDVSNISHMATQQLEKLLFNGLPTLAISLAAAWWFQVDKYMRYTQPYVELAKGGPGKKTVLLEYIHDHHLQVSWKALKNGHIQLSYVTLITTTIQLARIFVAGIFVFQESPSHRGQMLDLLQNWRSTSFPENTTTAFSNQVRDMALSRAVYGYPNIAGWQTGLYQFPAVDLASKDTGYRLTLDGVSANLTCQSVATQTTSLRNGTGWSAKLTDGDCSGAIWPQACALPSQSTLAVPGNLAADMSNITGGQCMAWRYLGIDDCQKLNNHDTGRWWIYGLSGNLDYETYKNVTLRNDSRPISLLCTPLFYKDTVELEVTRSGASSPPALDVISVQNRTTLEKDHWKSSTGKDFVSYSSELFNNSLAGDLITVTFFTHLDYLSAVTALNLTDSANGIFDERTLATSASQTFASIFAVAAGLDQTGGGNGSSFLLEAVSPTVNPRPQVQGFKIFLMAVVQWIPFYVGLTIMFLYCLSTILLLPFVFHSSKRRTPLDISYPANVMPLIYDSTLMEMVAGDRGTVQGTKDTRFKELEQERFKIGRFIGISGKFRVGIEREDLVEGIEKRRRWKFG